MAGWLIRRTLFAFATAWAISMLSFVVIQIPPGDYVTSYIAQLQSQGTIFTDDEAQALRDLYWREQNEKLTAVETKMKGQLMKMLSYEIAVICPETTVDKATRHLTQMLIKMVQTEEDPPAEAATDG